MSGAKLVVRKIRGFHQVMGKAYKVRKKACETATRVEGYRLKKVLEKEIKAGAPGGLLFRPLSILARRSRRGVNRRPLRALVKGVRYMVKHETAGMVVSIGFPESASKSWRRIAARHQSGYETSVTPAMRGYFGRVAKDFAGRKSSKIAGLSRFFNLKKSTTTLKTKKRPIIEPFWVAHKREAGINVFINFQRKMRGERI